MPWHKSRILDAQVGDVAGDPGDVRRRLRARGLRSAQQILGLLREKGGPRPINLPSVGFFDGATARLSFNLDCEIAFLAQARAAWSKHRICRQSAH